ARIAGSEPGVLCDALAVPDCCRSLLQGILAGRARKTAEGEITAGPLPGQGLDESDVAAGLALAIKQSPRGNLSVIYGETYILKNHGRFEEGVSQDLEIGRYLGLRENYHGSAPVVGAIEYRDRGSEPTTLGVLHRFIPNQGTAWQFTLDQLSQYFERVATLPLEPAPLTPPPVGMSVEAE